MGGYLYSSASQRFLQHEHFDGIAAKREEIIVDTHFINTKNLAKCFAYQLLTFIFGCSVICTPVFNVRFRKCVPVKLSIGVHGQLFQTGEK